MTAESDALLRSVLDAPADDAPRLVYADWLDEHGQPERAEFVRVQVAIARKYAESDSVSPTCPLRLRQRELFAGPWAVPWFGAVHPCLGRILFERSPPSDRCPVLGLIRRGFVAEVRCAMAAFLGGPCPCVRWVDATHRAIVTNCPTCQGTGEVAGLAPALFAAHPIASVRLTNAVIHPSGGNDTYYVGGLGSFPREYWRRLEGLPSRHAALKALDTVCVAHGRSLAGLPALEAARA